MARLKFLVFALLVLVLWAAHLVLLTPPVVSRSVELAMAQAQAARPLAAAQIADRRNALQRVATRLAAQPKLAAVSNGLRALPAKDAPAADKLQALRALAAEQAPDALRDALVVGYANDAGGTFFRGEKPAEGLDAALGQAGQDGMVQEAFGVTHLFVSLPVWSAGPGEPKPVGSIVLGAPLVAAGMMDAVAKDATLAAAGLFQGGRLVQGGGAEKAALEKAAKAAQLGKGTVVSRGAVTSLGPLSLPLFTAPDDRGGGRAPLLVASRQAIDETPYEFIAVTSVQPVMSALGDYQRFALGALVGLLVLAAVWAALMGAGPVEDDEEASETEPLPEPARAAAAAPPPAAEQTDEPTADPDLAPPPEPYRAPAPLTATMPDPSEEAGDPRLQRAISDLATTREMEEPPPSSEPTPEPPTRDVGPPLPLPPDEPGAPPFAGYAAAYETPRDEPATRADMPWGSPGDDFGQADAAAALARAGHEEPEQQAWSSDPNVPPPIQDDDNPDATRVATIPQELLAASARNTRPTMPAPPQRSAAPIALPKVPAMAAPPAAASEDAHWQDVFRDFVATRERCGEPSDAGLTYDKFAAKLKKNKEQLVQKYACRTVRFQVYVKDGKAALKATPVKD